MNTIVFAGDSITDCDRREDPAGLGNGYVRLIADALGGAAPDGAAPGGAARVVNRGISGNSARDLRDRWEADVLSEQPALVSVLVGINDTWRRYDSGVVTSAAEFEDNYRALLSSLTGVRIVLIEPFLLPVRDEQVAWREDLDPKLAVVRALAMEFDAVLVPADSVLRDAGAAVDVAPDGIHPSPWGHELLAQLWLDHAKVQP